MAVLMSSINRIDKLIFVVFMVRCEIEISKRVYDLSLAPIVVKILFPFLERDCNRKRENDFMISSGFWLQILGKGKKNNPKIILTFGLLVLICFLLIYVVVQKRIV
jgi:hypothetical protein